MKQWYLLYLLFIWIFEYSINNDIQYETKLSAYDFFIIHESLKNYLILHVYELILVLWYFFHMLAHMQIGLLPIPFKELSPRCSGSLSFPPLLDYSLVFSFHLVYTKVCRTEA